MQTSRKIHVSGFSIIEVMIGIFVFSLGLVAIFALLSSSLSVNESNKNSIIAGQLAREQIELIINIRDTNYKKLKLWNQHNPNAVLTIADKTNSSKVFLPDRYYFLGHDYSSGDIQVELLGTGSIPEGKTSLGDMNTLYSMCYDASDRYVKCDATHTQKTNFFKYIKLEQARDTNGNIIDDAFIVISKVIWYKRGYHEFEMKTIITDWRRI